MRRWIISVLFILTLGIMIIGAEHKLYDFAARNQLQRSDNESDEFRRQFFSNKSMEDLKSLSQEHDIPLWELLSVFMPDNGFDLSAWRAGENVLEVYQHSKEQKETYASEAYENLAGSYAAIWGDLQYFPVPRSDSADTADVSFEDSWLVERSYGGTREHEGCDVMAGENESGLYPIVSMTDGVVEKIGWLEQGGYRIGIRSPKGAYFYYAHLSEYAKEFEIGEEVAAGDHLGFMGDTGYGEEGTTGQFDVHLHLGVYISTENEEELSVNPYWILRYLAEERPVYSY